MINELTHSDWSKTLREGFAQTLKLKKERKVQLPGLLAEKTSPEMRITGRADDVTMTLNAAAVSANMQEDRAAFEAWALALWTWADVRRITLDWEIPANSNHNGHYQRFLFRVGTMLELFQRHEFRVAECREGVCEARVPFTHVNLRENQETWVVETCSLTLPTVLNAPASA